MGFEHVMRARFDGVIEETDFIMRSHRALSQLGFTNDNSIASVCVCRDEISQSLRSHIREAWGEAFNFSSLAGMFTAGKTGLLASMHHAPTENGRQRFIYYILPHTAIDAEGRAGFCKRKGIQESSACGALCLFLQELYEGKLRITIDEDDIEENLMKRRLLREIPYGYVPDLIELTKITRKVIQMDIERVLASVVDTRRSDYALLTGIQIHTPFANYVWPSECYAVTEGKREEISLCIRI